MTSLTWKLALGLLSAGLIVSQAEAQRWGGRGGSGISIGIGSGWGGSGISVGVGSGGYYGGGYGRGYGGYYGGGRGYYGGGGYGYGRGYGGYYGGYGRGYYGSGGYYGGGGYGYSPYYGGSSYYSSPSYGYSSPSYGYVDTRSYGDSSPTVAANAPVGASGGTIEIASEAGTQLNYNLNEFPYQIREGQVQRLQEDRPWVIEFHRGGDRGQAAYSLSAGRYKFVETEEGWDLVKAKDSAGSATRTAERLDSRENPLPRTATRPDDLPSTSPATDDPARNVPDLPPGDNPARLTPPPPADGNDDDADRRGEGDRAPAGEDRDAGDTGTSSDGGTP